MTKRLPVSTQENKWSDSQQVAAEDLQTEQEHVDQGLSAVVNNHIGSGIIQTVLSQSVLLDTDTVAGFLDGKPIIPSQEPSDPNEGVQLEIELTDSPTFGPCLAFGRRQIKVCVIGLDINNNLQYDTFYFSKNKKYITSRHYCSVLSVLFNDMRGATSQSFNLSGRVIIREAAPFALSSDTIMVAQDQQPNLFFRDFYVDSSYATIRNLLIAAVPGFTADSLNIAIGAKQQRKLLRSDVVTQLGQKFQATTNNIQKITLLMSVEKNTTSPGDSDLNWTGDLVVSVYPLQSTVTSSSQIAPQLAIDFDPSNSPLAQASVNLTTLQSNGVTLDGYAQPVDFVFSNTPIASGGLVPGSFYAFTVKRSGANDKCNILMPVGTARVDNSRVTIFNGTDWIDISEENFWFQVWTDAVKVTDGQAYDAGQGMVLSKTIPDPLTGAIIDNSYSNVYFTTTQRFFAVLKSSVLESVKVQDQRTGNPILARKQYTPQLNLLTDSALALLKQTSEPLTIGVIQDKNIKSFDAGNSTITSKLTHFGICKNEVVIKVIDDNSNANNNVALITAIQNGSLVNASFTPNTSTPSIKYRIASADILTMIYGDIDGDGVVDDVDVTAATNLINKTLVTAPNSADYFSSTNGFTDAVSVSFDLLDLTNTVINTGTCSMVKLTDDSFATISNITFTSPYSAGGFAALGTSNVKFRITSGSNPTVGPANYGTFIITSIEDNTSCTINKFLMTTDNIMKVMRADINGDFIVNSSDVGYISNYALHVDPANAVAANVGTQFRVIRLRLENTIDRSDDYPYNISNRSTVVHAIQDLPINDSTLLSHNYVTSNITFSIGKALSWLSDLVVSTRTVRYVPSSFTYETSPAVNSCSDSTGIITSSYPTVSVVDAGRNDFYIPNNLVLGGGLVNVDGTDFRGDIEIGTIVLEMPTQTFDDEKSFNVFTDFVADTSGYGTTVRGYPCMRFADCSKVSTSALNNNQVRFSAAIQSFYSDINGTDPDGYMGIIVDPKIGVYIDYTTGIMKLNFSHLLEDSTILTLNTKIQITVYLKKAGFNNNFLFVDSAKMANILGL